MTGRTPPRLGEAILERYLPPADRDVVIGDLREEFRNRSGPRWMVSAWYLAQAARITARFQRAKILGGGWLAQDIRIGLRQLRRQPVFTIIATVALALGVGINAVITQLAVAVFFDPLPYPAHDRLAILENDFTGSATGGFGLSYLNAADLRARAQTIEDLAVFLDWQNVNLSGPEGAHRLEANFTTPDYFRLLGSETVIGRPLTADDNAAGDPAAVAVLSHGTWQRLFGGDPGVLGRRILLNGAPFEVVGVLHRDHVDARWESGGETDVFLPLMTVPRLLSFTDFRSQRDMRILTGLARIAPTFTFADRHRDLQAISSSLAVDYPNANEGWSFAATPVDEQFFEDVRTPTAALSAGAILVLVLVVVNLTNLTLMRATSRTREVAVRRALGAGPARILRQLVVESLMLAAMGGALGVVGAAWILEMLAGGDMLPVPRFTELSLSATTVLLAGGLTLLMGVTLGLIPAANLVRRPRLADDLREGGREAGGRRTGRMRAGLIVAEVAVAFVLLVGAGLMLQSFHVLRTTGYGFDTANLLTVRLDLRGERYGQEETLRTTARTLVEQIGAIPGVADAFIWSPNRMGHGNWVELLTREGRWDLYPDERTEASRHHVHPGTLSSLGIPLMEGRDVAPSDGPGSPPVAIVSQSLARHFWPDASPIGKRMASTDNGVPMTYQVIGVATDARHRTRLLDPFGPQLDIYIAFEQQPQRFLTVAVRTPSAVEPGALAPQVRAVIRQIDASLPLYDVTTMTQQMRTEEARARLSAMLVSIYAALTVALAALGVYGVLAHAVRGRTREIGVRVALGAGWRSIVRDVLGSALGLVGIGLGIGLVSAMASARALEAALYGVVPWNVPVFGAVTALLVLVAVAACLGPARRAGAVDPTIALRMEE